jgi:hypothetical protein
MTSIGWKVQLTKSTESGVMTESLLFRSEIYSFSLHASTEPIIRPRCKSNGFRDLNISILTQISVKQESEKNITCFCRSGFNGGKNKQVLGLVSLNFTKLFPPTPSQCGVVVTQLVSASKGCGFKPPSPICYGLIWKLLVANKTDVAT